MENVANILVRGIDRTEPCTKEERLAKEIEFRPLRDRDDTNIIKTMSITVKCLIQVDGVIIRSENACDDILWRCKVSEPNEGE